MAPPRTVEPTHFGTALQGLRELHGWTRTECAVKIPVGEPSLTAWELGYRLPPMATLYRIAELFDVPASELVGDRMMAASQQ